MTELEENLLRLIRSLLEERPQEEFTSHPEGRLPDDLGRRTTCRENRCRSFLRELKRLQIGEQRGRYWYVRADVWRDARSKKRKVEAPLGVDLDAALRRAGLRRSV